MNGIQRNLTGSKISTSSTKFVFYRAYRKNKMAAPASDWLRHFWLLFWNRWSEFNKTWQERRSQCPLQSLCFFRSIGKTRWPPWPLIGWDIFDFFSETAEWNSMKLDRKQDLNVLYQVWVLGRSEKQDGRPSLWLAKNCLTSSLKPLNRIRRNLTGSKISTSFTKSVFVGPIGKKRWPPWPMIGWDIFDLFSETAEQNSTKLNRKQDLNVLNQVCFFFGPIDKKRWPPWPIIGWDIFVFFWNCWTWLKEIWQEARSTKLCFSVWWVNKNYRPGWSVKKVAHCTQVHDMWPFGPLVSSPEPIGKTRLTLWPLIGWEIFDFFSETTERNSMTLDRKQDLNVLYQVCVLSGRSEKQNGRPGLWLAQIFSTSSLKPMNRTWQEARS